MGLAMLRYTNTAPTLITDALRRVTDVRLYVKVTED